MTWSTLDDTQRQCTGGHLVHFHPPGLQHPMDLGTVMAKAQGDAYANAGGALDDIRLVWQNCRAFNEPGSDVYKGCDELAGYVEQLWRQARLDRAPVGHFGGDIVVMQ